MPSPLINGKNYDWGNVQMVLLGVPTVGVTEISYKRSRESVNNYGAGYEPTSYGDKQFTYGGSITLYKDELIAIYKLAPGQSVLELPPHTISMIFSGPQVATSIDKINNVRFTDDPTEIKANDGSILCKIPFMYAGLEHK